MTENRTYKITVEVEVDGPTSSEALAVVETRLRGKFNAHDLTTFPPYHTQTILLRDSTVIEKRNR